MSRLIIVSNRVSYPSRRQNNIAGGLSVTLKMVLQKSGGMWFGWSGTCQDNTDNNLQNITKDNINYLLIDLSKQQINKYYYGFANSVLWPLCHYRTDLIKYKSQDYIVYREVNKLFANNLKNYLKPQDIIWIHDYHLIAMATELRKLGIKNRIGFFLHVPFPCYTLFCSAPPYQELLDDLCNYDLIGFQTKEDENNFLHSIKNKKIKTGVFPATIDSCIFEKYKQSFLPKKTWQEIVNKLTGQILTIGVDRLDYSKGITNRLFIYEHFLANNKEYIEKIKFLQITPKSRSDILDYKVIQQEVALQTGIINGRFSTLNWTPLIYINKNIEQSTLCLLYRSAKIAMLTPMRDGMNLVAKEYIASQNAENPGVLILSKFAGAAKKLTNALLINPYDVEACSQALKQAINMRLDERIDRWKPMKNYIDAHNTEQWCDSFLNILRSVK